MEDNEITYRLDSTAPPNLSSHPIECEQTYFAKHEKMFNGEEFAKIVVNLNLLGESYFGPENNGFFRIRWFTILNKEGNRQDDTLTWTNSDGFRIPPKSLTKGNFTEFITELINKAFKKGWS